MSQNTSQLKENKMGIMPVGRLLVQMSLPMMISMLVQALYNIVDSIFVSRISEKALTAVSLAFPIQTLIIAVATGTGVGINALLSKRLGQKNFEEVNKSAGNGIFLFILSFIVFIIIGIFVPRVYFESQTDDPEIVEYGVKYLTVILTVSPGCFIAILFERLLQSTGLTVLSMVSQLTGAIINIIFDPILIFACGMDITGAAVATVLGQIVAAIISVVLNIRQNKEAMAEVIENNLRKVIVEEHPTNPKYYEKMSVLLDELIRRRKEKTLDYEKYLQEQLALAGQILQPSRTAAYPPAINTGAKRALYDTVSSNEALALELDRQILATRRDGWRDNTIKTREVRNAIQDVLKTFETAEPEAQYLVDLAKNQQEY